MNNDQNDLVISNHSQDLSISYIFDDGDRISLIIPKEQIKKAFYLMNTVLLENGIKSVIKE